MSWRWLLIMLICVIDSSICSSLVNCEQQSTAALRILHPNFSHSKYSLETDTRVFRFFWVFSNKHFLSTFHAVDAMNIKFFEKAKKWSFFFVCPRARNHMSRFRGFRARSKSRACSKQTVILWLFSRDFLSRFLALRNQHISLGLTPRAK